MKYLVTSPGEQEITVNAENSEQAKRLACKHWGISPSDSWCGMSALKARRIRDEGRDSQNHDRPQNRATDQ